MGLVMGEREITGTQTLLKCVEDWEGKVALLSTELRLVSSQLPLLLEDNSDTVQGSS